MRLYKFHSQPLQDFPQPHWGHSENCCIRFVKPGFRGDFPSLFPPTLLAPFTSSPTATNPSYLLSSYPPSSFEHATSSSPSRHYGSGGLVRRVTIRPFVLLQNAIGLQLTPLSRRTCRSESSFSPHASRLQNCNHQDSLRETRSGLRVGQFSHHCKEVRQPNHSYP